MSFNYNSPIKINIPHIHFRSKPNLVTPPVTTIRDGFVSNPIYDEFGTKEQIEAVAKSNPRICELLDKYNLPVQVNIDELEKLKNGHMKNTRIVAVKIYCSLPEELKKEVSLSDLQEAAILHDYGKVLIPSEILNKKGNLNSRDREIMELHSELGFELLKNKGLSQKTLNLIKYHHQNITGKGYPKIDNDFKCDINLQILSTADKYTAMRESRCYKDSLNKYETLEILGKEVSRGLLSQDVYTALIKAV